MSQLLTRALPRRSTTFTQRTCGTTRTTSLSSSSASAPATARRSCGACRTRGPPSRSCSTAASRSGETPHCTLPTSARTWRWSSSSCTTAPTPPSSTTGTSRPFPLASWCAWPRASSECHILLVTHSQCSVHLLPTPYPQNLQQLHSAASDFSTLSVNTMPESEPLVLPGDKFKAV